MRTTLWIGLLIVGALTCGRANAQAPIPIVHTWGDLQSAPKLTAIPSHPTDSDKNLPAPKPVTFQIGLSSDAATIQSPVLLYFLGSTGSEHSYTPEEWGVYWLQIDGNPWEGNTDTRTFMRGEPVPPGTLFYAQSIPFLSAGDHVVELIKPFAPDAKPEAKKEVLARATIHVRDNPGDFWYPLWTTSDASGGAASGMNADRTRYATESVFNPKGDAAVPNPPRPRWYTEFPAPEQALPGLFPTNAAGSHVQLKMTEATLIMTFDPKIEGFFPDDYFLTRWWVNGKQAPLDPKAERPGQTRMLGFEKRNPFLQSVAFRPMAQWPSLLMGAQVWYTQEVHFDLSFKPDWLGAKKGDRVGVQFLYCPDGFTLLRMPSPEFTSEAEFPGAVFSRTGFSELSNRIEFTYSGDPKHPQQ